MAHEAGTSLESMVGASWQDAAATRKSEISRRVNGRTEVLLFGTGALGRQVLADLPEPFRAVGFVDNNPALWGADVLGLEVMSPAVAQARFGDAALWLITIYTNYPVIAQLRRLGVPWVTCAELSWLLPAPHPTDVAFGSPETLEHQGEAIVSAAGVWADEASRAEYASQVRWRFLLDYDALAAPRPVSETYFPDDLVAGRADEVFVDCGAFTGDTVDAFLSVRAGLFGRIVAIEPDVENCRALERHIRTMYPNHADRIRVEPFALGSQRGRIEFSSTGTVRSKVGGGVTTVDVATMDELLASDRPTYVKFDIEGAEHDAIVGGSEVIQANMPVLAVSAYHKPEDIWDLPLLIRSIAPDYLLYLRRYSDERWEQVLYAVPPDRLVR